MSDWERQWREAERAQRRAERAALQRQREIARQLRLEAKATEQERARLEVQEHETRIEVLLSLHRECAASWDWLTLAATLAPLPPTADIVNEWRTHRELMILPDPDPSQWERVLELARADDRRAFVVADERFRETQARWQKITALAQRILAGDTAAYRDAMEEFSPLAELADLGSSIDFTMHSVTTIECVLAMNGTHVIPSEAKALTATGKLSVKAMPRQQFHEIYQDYICGGILRVARESFALLPIERIFVTTLAPLNGTTEQPVLSVVINRTDLQGIDFETVDASDTVDRLTHRGDFKASRKSGAFQPITPFTSADLAAAHVSHANLSTLRARVATERAAVQAAQQAFEENSAP